MAKIIRTQEVEISFERLIALIKKNWALLDGYIDYDLDGEIVRVNAAFGLVDISNSLRRTESLIVQTDELGKAITQIFRELESQNPHFKDMDITVLNPPSKSLTVSFNFNKVF